MESENFKYLTEVVTYKSFITENERQDLYNLAVNRFNQGFFRNDNPNLPVKDSDGNLVHTHQRRYSFRFNSVDMFSSSPLFKMLSERVIAIMGMRPAKRIFAIDTTLGWLVNYIEPGGFISKHTDSYKLFLEYIPPRLHNFHHVRFNVMVNRGTHISYSPIVNDKIIDIDQCDAWCFPADTLHHKIDPILGSEPRVVYQFGFAISPS